MIETNINYSMLQLAFIGDAVFELFIREYLMNKNIVKVKELKEASLNYVTASKQNDLLFMLINNNILSEEELDIVKRGRNTKTHSKPKGCDIVIYRHATAFEALLGYLYLTNKERLYEILNIVVEM